MESTGSLLAIFELFISITSLQLPPCEVFGLPKEQKYIMFSGGEDAILIYIHFDMCTGRAERFPLRRKRLVWYDFYDVIGDERHSFPCIIRVRVENDETSGGRRDESWRLIEWRYDALSLRSNWNLPVVGKSVQKFACRLYFIAIGIVVYHCVSRLVKRIRRECADCLEMDRYDSLFEQEYSGDGPADV